MRSFAAESRSSFTINTEKSRLFWSFILALTFHAAIVFFGTHTFIKAPDFGIQGSSASMEIYMVAARPETKIPKVREIVQASSEMLPEGKSEMRTASETRANVSSKSKSEKSSPPVQPEEKKHAVKGDGSSAIPGTDATTFFSAGSSEIAGKAGKYQNPPPQYPEEAQRNGWEGLAVVSVLIEKEGKPSKVTLGKSSGHRLLDQAAVETVKDWRFSPGKFGGITVSSWIQIPIRFVLEKKNKF